MASIGSDKGTRGTAWRVLITVKSGGVAKRHTIRLGRVNRRIAETAKRMIESLEAAKATGHSLDGETANWVAAISDEIHARLSRAGLVPPRQQAAAEATLGAHLAAVFATLGTQKKNTAASYQRARRLLEEFFGQDRLLAGVCPGDADGALEGDGCITLETPQTNELSVYDRPILGIDCIMPQSLAE